MKERSLNLRLLTCSFRPPPSSQVCFCELSTCIREELFGSLHDMGSSLILHSPLAECLLLGLCADMRGKVIPELPHFSL